MAATTTFTSMSSSSKSSLKELCSMCKERPYDLICTCGDKFDFKCVQKHVEDLSYEFQGKYDQSTGKLVKVKELHANQKNHLSVTRTAITNWQQKWIQNVNDIADKAFDDIQQRENMFTDVSSYEDTYEQVSNELHRVAHENLDKVIELNRQIQGKIDDIQNLPAINQNDASLDALIQAKLHPSTLRRNISSSAASNINNRDDYSANTFSSVAADEHNENDLTTSAVEPRISLSTPTTVTNRNSLPPQESTVTNRNSYPSQESTITNTNTSTTIEPAVGLKNTTNGYEATTESTNQDEFDAGLTSRIQRTNPIMIATNRDLYAGTICCHDNQLLYNTYDQTMRSSRLVFIPDITNPTVKLAIDWDPPMESLDVADDEWIQDIVYSDKLSGYLILNRSRLRLYKSNANTLEEFHAFPGRSMRRLTCNEKMIYLTSTHGGAPYDGDEIKLINYDKEEKINKTFREIIPTRLNRGAGPLAGEISDIAIGLNEQITIGYRLERRQEVGVCVFNLANNGKEWSCVKQLLLNECWHSDLSYTPRIDWCAQLNVFILIEYMTGHLILIDQDGQVDGECRFMQGQDRRQSPINLTISTNDWLCVRYDTSISIHKITS